MAIKITLIGATEDPARVVLEAWELSKRDVPIADLDIDPNSASNKALFQRIVAQHLPITEMVDFTFAIEGVSISWREQAVRHRIGTNVGERMGVDIAPDLADSSWWSQSMRILSMGAFADNHAYRVPTTIQAAGLETEWHDSMKIIQEQYNKYVDLGIPMQDARDVVPLGATHSIVWKLNLAALMHIVGKRSCWILQSDLWLPVITGMMESIRAKFGGMFDSAVLPPCIRFKNGEPTFAGCAYELENQRRVDGDDALPVCPMYNFNGTDVESQVEALSTKWQKEWYNKIQLWGPGVQAIVHSHS